MIFKNKYLLIVVLILSLNNCCPFFFCAQQVTKPESRYILIFKYKLKGKFLFRQDITYHIVIYSPFLDTPGPLDPNIGPRINGPALNIGTAFLKGRLPFISDKSFEFGDLPSKWTDFYYITGRSGNILVGKGKNNNGEPEITNRDYGKDKWELESPETFKIEIPLSDLSSGSKPPDNIIVNLAVSTDIDFGAGLIYDYWKQNTPFSISTKNNTFISDQDVTAGPVKAKSYNYPYIPTLPVDISEPDVDILGFEAKIRG